jgi:hypothetical protein
MLLGRPDISHCLDMTRAAMIAKSAAYNRGMGITLLPQVGNLAAIYEMYRRRKLEIQAKPVDEFQGDRVFYFLDPLGIGGISVSLSRPKW